jgi:hypothetical protein
MIWANMEILYTILPCTKSRVLFLVHQYLTYNILCFSVATSIFMNFFVPKVSVI